MLGSNYITINGTGYTPTNFSYSLKPMEEVFESAAGTELLNVIRLDKHEFDLSWEGIDDTLLDALEALCKLPIVTLVYRENTYTCRARNIKPELLKKTYKYRHSNGLWNASLKLTEL